MTYRGGSHPERWGRYGDCFAVSVDREVSLADFVFAFYTSPVFRVERLLLRLAGAPANDADARALVEGASATFAIWYVGRRTADQLLMCDRYERTRSWFRVTSQVGDRTLLQFGSAVAGAAPADDTAPADGAAPADDAAPAVAAAPGGGRHPRRRGAAFRLLLGFHVVYSQLLLSAAKRKILRVRRARAAR